MSVGGQYKPDSVGQVQPRGVSMIMSSDSAAVPYGMVPQFSTLQIGNSVNFNIFSQHKQLLILLCVCILFSIAVH